MMMRMMRRLKLGILEGKLGLLVAEVDSMIKLHLKILFATNMELLLLLFPGCCINFCLWTVKSHENKCDCFKCAIYK